MSATLPSSQTAPVLNPFDSSMGSHVVGTVPMYDFQIWESVLAMLCRVFRLGAAELCHTAMLPPLLLLAASAAFSLGLSLLGNERRAYLFTFVLSVFYIFSGANGYSVGAFLLGRVWQGKAASLTIVLPVLSALPAARAGPRRESSEAALDAPAGVYAGHHLV